MRLSLKALIVCIALSGWFAAGSSLADPGSDAEAERKEMWDSLSDEEKEKLRTALREVWTDPAVINARDEVKSAAEAYQKAIREAVSKADPSMAELMAKAEKSIEGRIHDRIGGPPSGRSGMFRRAGDYPMSPPGFAEKLSPEEQEKFRKAEEAAKETPEVKKAQAALRGLHKQDEEMRRKRLEAHRQMRQAVLTEMVKKDPSLKELQNRLELNSPARGGKGGIPGNGSGPKGKGKTLGEAKE
ncbi:MAG: hypothetical protein HRU46_18140 [Verrucomicrobiales bacterium]|nr:hypothetical protein [Verrucomicrobiales bacterium]